MRLLEILAAISCLACSSNVVVGESAGAGAASGDASGAVGTGSNATGGESTRCPEACDAVSACLEASVDCVSRCRAASDGCTSAQDDWLACVVSMANACTISSTNYCDQMLTDFLQCRDEVVGDSGCTIGNTCDCHESSNSHSYESSCSPSASGQLSCNCSVDGVFVGSCGQNGQECLPSLNCCAALLFVPGP